MEKYRIGLFGGSFDPPTKAHLHVAEELIRKGVVDMVEFVPAYVSFHGKEYQAVGSDRIQMLNELISYSKYSCSLSVNTFEIENKLTSCTYDFIDKFLEYADSDYTYCRHNVDNKDNVQFYFIVGGDNAKMIPNFKKGHDGGRLMDRIPMIVVNRGNTKVDDIEWCNKEPHIVANIEEKYATCSSTKVRNEIANMEENGVCADFFNEWCTISVFAYIMECGLYGLSEPK